MPIAAAESPWVVFTISDNKLNLGDRPLLQKSMDEQKLKIVNDALKTLEQSEEAMRLVVEPDLALAMVITLETGLFHLANRGISVEIVEDYIPELKEELLKAYPGLRVVFEDEITPPNHESQTH